MLPISSPSTAAESLPSTITKNSRPSSPCRVTSSPTAASCGCAMAAIRPSSSSLQVLKSQIPRSSGSARRGRRRSSRRRGGGNDLRRPRTPRRRRRVPITSTKPTTTAAMPASTYVIVWLDEPVNASRPPRTVILALSTQTEPRTVRRCSPGAVPSGIVMVPAKLPWLSVVIVPIGLSSKRTCRPRWAHSPTPGTSPRRRPGRSGCRRRGRRGRVGTARPGRSGPR